MRAWSDSISCAESDAGGAVNSGSLPTGPAAAAKSVVTDIRTPRNAAGKFKNASPCKCVGAERIITARISRRLNNGGEPRRGSSAADEDDRKMRATRGLVGTRLRLLDASCNPPGRTARVFDAAALVFV